MTCFICNGDLENWVKNSINEIMVINYTERVA